MGSSTVRKPACCSISAMSFAMLINSSLLFLFVCKQCLKSWSYGDELGGNVNFNELWFED